MACSGQVCTLLLAHGSRCWDTVCSCAESRPCSCAHSYWLFTMLQFIDSCLSAAPTAGMMFATVLDCDNTITHTHHDCRLLSCTVQTPSYSVYARAALCQNTCMPLLWLLLLCCAVQGAAHLSALACLRALLFERCCNRCAGLTTVSTAPGRRLLSCTVQTPAHIPP